MVEKDNFRILVDAGPDFRQQMLRHQVNDLDAVLLTHEHADHIFGLDDIRSFNWLRKSAMDIFCEKRVQDNLKTIFNYVFAENKYPGAPSMKLIQITGEPFHIGPFEVIPIRLYHHHLPVYGFRFDKFAYLTDFNRIDDHELMKLRGIETLIICALRHRTHISHLNLEGALDLIRKISPKMAYLTHMSHEIGKHSDLLAELPEGVKPAYDGLVIEVD
jgi:phosphoribosyl 1,2-cyclic phosphate phosphodiesterase